MATDWSAMQRAATGALWSAGALFLEGLFWVLLHFISKLAGLVQQGVETFILVARRPDAVHECWGEELSDTEPPFYDTVSPPIYGYGRMPMSVPITQPVNESPTTNG